MIKDNELRIGNLVKDYTGKIIKIESSYFCGSGYVPSSIELTEEWLLKFGFVKDGFRYYKGNLYWWENDFYYEFYDESADSINIAQNIKYVHQLQNLYFALTGSELSVSSHLVQP